MVVGIISSVGRHETHKVTVISRHNSEVLR